MCSGFVHCEYKRVCRGRQVDGVAVNGSSAVCRGRRERRAPGAWMAVLGSQTHSAVCRRSTHDTVPPVSERSAPARRLRADKLPVEPVDCRQASALIRGRRRGQWAVAASVSVWGLCQLPSFPASAILLWPNAIGLPAALSHHDVRAAGLLEIAYMCRLHVALVGICDGRGRAVCSSPRASAFHTHARRLTTARRPRHLPNSSNSSNPSPSSNLPFCRGG